MIRLLLFYAVLLSAIFLSNSIKCFVGYGQRGLKAKNEISWTRECPYTRFCFEVVTTDIEKVKHLIDYPWDKYYSQYFIRSCGGDFGTDPNAHPYKDTKGKSKSVRRKARSTIGYANFTITTPHVVTGHGGTEVLDLHYVCRKSLCSSASHVKSFTTGAMVVVVVASWLLL